MDAFLASIRSNKLPDRGHHAKTSPDLVRREEKPHPHSTWMGLEMKA
jgi:hypothetical protein